MKASNHNLATAFLALLLAIVAGGARASVKGNLNGDQIVSIADLTLLLNIILEGDYSLIPDSTGGEF